MCGGVEAGGVGAPGGREGRDENPNLFSGSIPKLWE